jgi:hypothetical protein
VIQVLQVTVINLYLLPLLPQEVGVGLDGTMDLVQADQVEVQKI